MGVDNDEARQEFFAKLSKTDRMGKEDAKKAHRSGKVSIVECAKSKVEKIEDSKKRRPVT